MEDPGFRQQALIYAGAKEYLAGTVPFVEAARKARDPLLVAVGPVQTERLQMGLAGSTRGVRFLPMQEVGRNPARIIPLWRDFVDEHAGRRVRGIGEPVWPGRSRAELEECRRHEALLNLAFSDDPDFMLLCPFDAAALPIERLERHPDCFAGELPPPDTQPETLRFGITGLAEVRLRVAAVAARSGMCPRAVADLVTAASELAANSVIHGGGTGTLRLWRENGSLLTEVEDRGRIEEPLVGRRRPGLTQEGGRGLWLANLLCDLVQIRSGERGTVVRLHTAMPDRSARPYGDRSTSGSRVFERLEPSSR